MLLLVNWFRAINQITKKKNEVEEDTHAWDEDLILHTINYSLQPHDFVTSQKTLNSLCRNRISTVQEMCSLGLFFEQQENGLFL
jgi:hypothetical protein